MKKALILTVVALLLICSVSCKKPTASSLPSSADASSAISSSQSSKNPSSSVSSSSKPVSSQSKPSSTVSHPQNQSGGEEAPPEVITPSLHSEHYCYKALSDIQKQYYDVLHTAVEEMQTSWIVLGPISNNYVADIAVVRTALSNDHPDIFWLPPYYATATGVDPEGNPSALMMLSASPDVYPSYLVTRSEKDIMQEELDSAVKKISSKVTATTPYEIELQLHDLLLERVEYTDDDSDDPQIYTAYGALVNGRALCEGYSRAMQLLLSKFGIPCLTVTGVAQNEGHMWNAVELDGKWYNLDATWNDTKTGFISHEYFNVSDGQIALDHSFSPDYTEVDEYALGSGSVSFNISRPVCDGLAYNYFSKSGFVYSPENTDALVNYILAADSDTLEVGFASKEFRDLFYNDFTGFVEGINQELFQKELTDSPYISKVAVGAIAVRLHLSTWSTRVEPTDTPLFEN